MSITQSSSFFSISPPLPPSLHNLWDRMGQKNCVEIFTCQDRIARHPVAVAGHDDAVLSDDVAGNVDVVSAPVTILSAHHQHSALLIMA